MMRLTFFLIFVATALRALVANRAHVPAVARSASLLAALALAPALPAALAQRTYLNCGSATMTVMCRDHGMCECGGVPPNGRPNCDPDLSAPLECDALCWCRGKFSPCHKTTCVLFLVCHECGVFARVLVVLAAGFSLFALMAFLFTL